MRLWDKDKNKIKICIKWTSIKNTLSSNIVNAINDDFDDWFVWIVGWLLAREMMDEDVRYC